MRRAVGVDVTVTAVGASPSERGAPLLEPEEGREDLDEEIIEIPPSLHARFENFQFLGRGGTGAVYRAKDFRLGREVAIKFLFGADPEHGGGLLREAKAQARVAHESVCEVYEVGSADHQRFIVMQLIHGEPLDRAKAEMTLEEKVRVIRLVASALHEAHRLGLIHRDVKPSNIMVERAEDGTWKPYIMDFGLAREVGDSGRTVTGALMGTPAFMAPEQAAGKVRSLDRRTDVYGLGATLYDLLSDRQPFVAESLFELLAKVVAEEPKPLGALDRNIPRDLEAIVMKCLEKEPSARYESAKALGEDLQRFLDGDAVMARRGALGYQLLKRAKKHKAAMALAGAVLFTVAIVALLWVHDRRVAAEQASLSRELGESVKEMELFLRNAHGMPLHDIAREREIVRLRLKEIEARMDAAGEVGLVPGHYALGRGHLALEEPELALFHLEQAATVGCHSPGLDYSLGITLSALYKKELEETKRLEGEEQRKKRIAAIEAEYKEPALRHLRAALGGAIDAPAYVEGLIAFYEGRLDEALVKARQAFAKAPWLYEAKKLEGDVLFAMGSRYGHDAAFDYDAMMAWYEKAAEAYELASNLGRSDPGTHEAACELWTQVMNGAFAHGDPMRPSFDKATAACQRAIAASPRRGAGYVKLAWVHNCFAWRVATGEPSNERPEAAIAEAVLHAEEAAQRSPDDPLARYVVGAVWRSRALYASDRGLDVSPAIDYAIAAYEKALRLDPSFLWALNELCSSLTMRGRRETRHGASPEASLKQALAHCDRAIAIEPGFIYPRASKIVAHLLMVEHLVATGRSPESAVQTAEEVIEALKKQSPNHGWLPFWISTLRRLEATWALESGEDPGPALEAAEAGARELEQKAPSSLAIQQLRGEAAAIRARWMLSRGEDPETAIHEAREHFRLAVEAKPWDLGFCVWSARVEIIALRWALHEGRVNAIREDAALEKLLPLLDRKRADPSLYEALAEIHELNAAFRQRRGEDAGSEIAKGLERIEEALAINPHMASALACKERLLVLRKAKVFPSERIYSRRGAGRRPL